MAAATPVNVLVFSKTAGYRHESIPTAVNALKDLASHSGLFTVTATEDASLFEPTSLSSYQVIVLLHTSGTFLRPSEFRALQQYVRSGGGVLAIHGAASGMPSSGWYGKLIGVHFDMHPDAEPGSLIVSDASHPVIDNVMPPEKWMDEWYNFSSHPVDNPNLQILLRGDTNTFKGSKHGGDHPLAWCQEFEGSRSLYIALGHFDKAWDSEWYVGLVKRGIFWVASKT